VQVHSISVKSFEHKAKAFAQILSTSQSNNDFTLYFAECNAWGILHT